MGSDGNKSSSRQPLERVKLERRHTHTHEASWLRPLKLACCNTHKVTRVNGIGSQTRSAGLLPAGFGLARGLTQWRPPQTSPHPTYPTESACASGAGVATPTEPPPKCGERGRHGACVAHTKLCPSPGPSHYHVNYWTRRSNMLPPLQQAKRRGSPMRIRLRSAAPARTSVHHTRHSNAQPVHAPQLRQATLHELRAVLQMPLHSCFSCLLPLFLLHSFLHAW